VGAAVTFGQQPAPRTPSAAPAPAAAAPSDIALPPDNPNASPDNANDTPQVKKDREWLVAYLIAHQGYRIEQMDALEKRIDRMTPTQVETLIDVYQQKHQMALSREANWQQLQQQQFALMQTQQAQLAEQQDEHTKELDQAANLEQSRLEQQRQQAETPMNFPTNYGPALAPFYGGYGPGYGAYYDRYWH